MVVYGLQASVSRGIEGAFRRYFVFFVIHADKPWDVSKRWVIGWRRLQIHTILLK